MNQPFRFTVAALVFSLSACQCGTHLAHVPDGLVLDPAALDFGQHRPGEVQSKTVTLTNTGKTSLELFARVEGDARSAFSLPAKSLSLPAGEAAGFEVVYTAGTDVGLDVATLHLEASQGAVEVALSGEVVDSTVLFEGPTGDAGQPDAGPPDAGVPACPGGVAELLCGNGQDDDCDGKVDCADSDCAGVGACAPPVCDPTGELKVSTIPAGAYTAAAPDVAWNGSEFLVAWISAFTAGGADLALSRVSATGLLLGGPTAVTTGRSAAHPPRLSVSGADWVVGFSGATSTAQVAQLQFVDAAGALSGAPLQLGNGWPVTVGTRPGSTSVGVLWGASGAVGNRPSFTPVASRARAGADLTVSPTSGSTDYGDLVWNGTGWAAVWDDLRANQSNTYFTLLDAQGYAVGGELKLSSGAGQVYQPRLVWTGSEYGVSWSEWGGGATQNVFFTRVSAAGVQLGTAVKVTASTGSANSADLAWTGSRYAIVYQDDAGQPAGSLGQAYLLLLDPAGAVVGVPRRVSCAATGSGHRPSVAWNGSALAVAWGDNRAGNLEVYFRLVVP